MTTRGTTVAPKQTEDGYAVGSDIPMNESDKSKSGMLNSLAIAIVALVVMIVLILWVTMSRFVDHFSIPILFFVAGIALAFFRGTQLMNGECDYRFLLIFGLVLAIGAYMINLDNVNHAWTGAIVLLLAFVLDAGYSLYMKYSMKKAVNEMVMWGGIIADVVLIGLLIYGLTGDM